MQENGDGNERKADLGEPNPPPLDNMVEGDLCNER